MTHLFSLILLAATALGADLLAPWPTTVYRNEVVAFRAKSGHHFSLEAPQKCAGQVALEVTPRVIRCQFSTAGDAQAVVNVCDDKKTFCRPVTADLKVLPKDSGTPARLIKNEHLNQKLKATLVPGFTVGAPENIKAEALTKGRPVFVMISTDWCPPCNEAKEYLLKSERFNQITKDWFKVYVDGDSLAAADWDRVVPFRYYPSFVLLNSDFKEVARFNRELRESEFAAWASEELMHVQDPIENLKERVLKRRDKSLWTRISRFFKNKSDAVAHAEEVRLLRWALDRQDKTVMDRLIPSGSYPELTAEIKRQEIAALDEAERPDSERKKAAYGEILKVTLEGDDWAENLDAFCDEDAATCEPHFNQAGLRLEFLKSRAGLTPTERESVLGEELLNLASVAEKLKKADKQKDFAERCLKHYEALKKLSPLGVARSSQQYMVPCYEFAGRFQEAEKALSKLIAVYPSEPTFHLRLARVLRKQKLHDKALAQVEKGIKVAYGYNWFTAVLLKSDILLDLKRAPDAEKTIEDALNEVQLSAEPTGRNQILVGRLRAAQAKIGAIKTQ